MPPLGALPNSAMYRPATCRVTSSMFRVRAPQPSQEIGEPDGVRMQRIRRTTTDLQLFQELIDRNGGKPKWVKDAVGRVCCGLPNGEQKVSHSSPGRGHALGGALFG